MSNGIKVILLLVAVLFSSFAMTFAQDTPFQVEVVVSVARMRWGPGPTFVVQHYANAGHALTVLEVDSTSNPPWTWYYARTPSNVVAWIRADLVRLATGAAAVVPQVENPTGTYPVAFDNLCNTAIFRSCQDGTDFLLWQAGYWAFDRYEHWERGGWNLDVVYHQNPCKLDRLCSTKEEWDAGRLEAQVLAITATPEGTLTPFAIEVTVVKEIQTEVILLTAADARRLLGRDVSPPGELYHPPAQLFSGATLIGRFRFDRESVSVTCQYWHNRDQVEPTDFVKSQVFTIREFAADDKDYDVNCLSGHVDDTDVVARQWRITISRTYAGQGRIRNVSWKLTGTYGRAPTDACTDDSGPCVTELLDAVEEYLASERIKGTLEEIGSNVISHSGTSTSCEARKTTEGESPSEVTRYEHTCENETGELESVLRLNFTHDKRRGFLPTPTAVPPPNN